jgi:hypothetical protein
VDNFGENYGKMSKIGMSHKLNIYKIISDNSCGAFKTPQLIRLKKSFPFGILLRYFIILPK